MTQKYKTYTELEWFEQLANIPDTPVVNAVTKHYYSVGDKVRMKGYPGKIVKISPNRAANASDPIWKKRKYIIEFDDKTLIPCDATADLLESNDGIKPNMFDLSGRHLGRKMDTDKYCPICKSEWKVTKSMREIWYDCLTCNRTKEDIMKGQ